MSAIEKNIEDVRARIDSSLKNAGRTDKVRLMAVTKYRGVDEINQAMTHGIDCIGENRVGEAEGKFPLLKGQVEKHMIGHLQTNKVKRALEIFDVIHSVDSYKLAREIDKRGCNIDKIIPILFEVNISGEEVKYGIGPDEAHDFYNRLMELSHLKVIGMMAMAPHVEPENTRPFFRKMKELNDSLKLRYISMGMTNDFQIAVEEGSNLVRIGTGLFG